MKIKKDSIDFATALQELEKINVWFQQDDLDLDLALQKLKRGKELLAICKTRLKSVETEITELEQENEEEDSANVSSTPAFQKPTSPFGSFDVPAAPSPDDDDLPF